jgi:hypothetical protein
MLAVGGHSMTATYNPNNSNFAPSTSAVLTQVVNPTPGFTTFSSASSSMILKGSASFAPTTSPTLLQLTPELTGQDGSAWFKYPQPVKNGFTTTFTYNITDPNNATASSLYPADGITFVVQNAAAGLNALGGGGGSIGYGPTSPGCTSAPCGVSGSVENSLVIEFDTFDNSTAIGDPNGNHVAVQSCGAGQQNTPAHAAPGSSNNTFNWPNCNVMGAITTPSASLTGQHTVTITYDASLHTLTVQLDPNTPNAVTVISLSNFNLTPYVNFAGPNTDSAYVGFTSATGALEEETDVLSWTFTPHF